MAETIFALSSGAGRAGVAVVRVSGPMASEAGRSLLRRPLPPPRRATLAALHDPDDGEILDRGLVLWFPGPASYTGEDVLELHVHGGRAVVAAVLEALARCRGLRPAEAGEFTRRAFEYGRLDLTAAEGVADLVAAETAAQRRQALRQAEGALAAVYEGWRGRLVDALARLEADLDFPEEGLPEDLAAATRGELAALAEEMSAHLDDGRRGERLRDGLSVAIVGAPNVGKSSLLNRLARREAAIVSATAGTTRDVVEIHLDLGGYPVIVADTAGLRESAATGVGDEVEREGIRRARARAEAADLKLAVFETGRAPDAATVEIVDEDTVVVMNKADLGADLGPGPATVAGRPALAVSARTGQGLEALAARLEREVENRLSGCEAPAMTRVRHRRAVEAAAGHLRRALAAEQPELRAEDVRLAVREVGRITGRVDVEEILDVIFGEFCIGK